MRTIDDFDNRFEKELKPLLLSGGTAFDEGAKERYVKYLQEKEAAMAGLLSKEEMKTVDMTMSRLAEHLRFRFSTVEMSEQQFQEFYDFAKPQDVLFDGYLVNKSSPEFLKAWEDLNIELIKKAQRYGNVQLGPSVPEDLKKRLGLP